MCLADATKNQTTAKVNVGGAPGHIAFEPEGECAFIGCEATDEVAVIDLSGQRVLDLIKVGDSVS